MTTVAKKNATYADLEALPPHLVGEIIFGNLITHPRPVAQHGAAAYNLGLEIGFPFQRGRGGPGGWIFLPEPEIHFGPHIAVPDLAGWRSERLPPGAISKAYIDVRPDWICEVLSSATEKYDKGDKRRIYALYNVEHLWYVDPRAKSLEVFARRDTDWLLTHTFFDNDDINAPPFDAITFKLGLLWPFDPPETPPTT